MARPRRPRSTERPAPLPPAERTVGQLVGETIRIYAAHWKRALAIGVLPAIVGVAAVELGGWRAVVLGAAVGSLVQTASYLVASALVGGVELRRPQALVAFAAGVVVFLPVPFLAVLLVLPALVWLAFVGLVVPVALIERTTLARSFGRAVELARADFAHMLGGLATLAILTVLCQGVVALTLQEFSEQTSRVAAGLAGVVLTPLLFIGAAVLYVDQEARSRPRGEGRVVSARTAK